MSPASVVISSIVKDPPPICSNCMFPMLVVRLVASTADVAVLSISMLPETVSTEMLVATNVKVPVAPKPLYASMSTVAPVMVPELNYENMEISNGSDAIAQFAYLARGKYDKEEVKVVRNDLLEYCKLDTLAMVKVWERLGEMVG